MTDDIQSELGFYKQYARTHYDENSIVKSVCRLQKCDKEDKFRRPFNSFNAPWKFHKDLLNKTTTIHKINELVDDVVIKETTHLFNQIKTKSIVNTTQDDLYNRISKEIVNLVTDYRIPCCIVIPRSHVTSIPKWNGITNPNIRDNSYKKLIVSDQTLDVVIPMQKIQFNDIIITSRYSNVWEFIPQENAHPLEVGYELTESLNIPFWVRTTCRFEDIQQDGNVVIENIM